MSEPFGALRPSSTEQFARDLAARLPDNYFGRRAASLLLGPAGGRSGRAFDVDIFGSQRARLHPVDNICEKRVFLTPQFWEAEERRALADFITGSDSEDLYFFDVGANVGLYTLFARARALRAGKSLKAVCIEADPEMAARLAFNLTASSMSGDATIIVGAASGENGILNLALNEKSRGESRITDSGGLRVPARTLLDIARECAVPRIDAMKVDIEGHEAAALTPFFLGAADALLPRFLLVETTHEAGQPIESIVAHRGYRAVLRTRRNIALARSDQAFG